MVLFRSKIIASKFALIWNRKREMRGSTYPPAIRTYLKIVPACTMYLYIAGLHPLMVYNIAFHTNERIERVLWARTTYEKTLGLLDEHYRHHWYPKILSQPFNLFRYHNPTLTKVE